MGQAPERLPQLRPLEDTLCEVNEVRRSAFSCASRVYVSTSRSIVCVCVDFNAIPQLSRPSGRVPPLLSCLA